MNSPTPPMVTPSGAPNLAGTPGLPQPAGASSMNPVQFHVHMQAPMDQSGASRIKNLASLAKGTAHPDVATHARDLLYSGHSVQQHQVRSFTNTALRGAI
jgi:hypothetical protein